MLVNKSVKSQTILPAGGEVGDINMGIANYKDKERGHKQDNISLKRQLQNHNPIRYNLT